MRKGLIVCLFLVGISLPLLADQEADGFIEMDYDDKCLWIEKKEVFPEDVNIVKGVRVRTLGEREVKKVGNKEVLGEEVGGFKKDMTFYEFVNWITEGKAEFVSVSFVAAGSGKSSGYVIIYYKWKKVK